MSALDDRLRRDLDARAAASRRRELRRPGGVDCSSNDYLGLSDHPAVLAVVRDAAARGVAAGSAGSRLLSGNHPEHERAEELFARFIGREAALLFSSGYAANLALLSALPSRHDMILLDASSHASLKEGARASLATKRSFRHNSVDDLARALGDRERFDQAFVVVEGVYSMDGDRAPLAAMAELAARFDAHLIVDEAHATGLYGAGLRGVHELEGIVPLSTVHPCGKALGSSGAFIAADRLLIDYLINNARPFLFSTAGSPLHAAGLAASVELLGSMGEEAARLLASALDLRARLGALRRWRVLPSDSPIIPIIIGSDADAVDASRRVASRGFDLRAIRPPTVPDGTSRLRISLTTRMSAAERATLAEAIIAAEEESA
jgi:8-amino-7-oxononanoate synthase